LFTAINKVFFLCCNITHAQAAVSAAAWRNGIASDYDCVIRRLQVRPLRWSFFFCLVLFSPLATIFTVQTPLLLGN
jgi:hypothetical protein